MKKIKKLIDKLFNINMTWKKIIIFAIISAIYTALINQVPFLKDTSFRDIAISFECWIFFAIIIMVNCKKPLESALKTFVFFLISQPLVYIIEIPFLGVEVLEYYRNWITWTILVLPMAFFGNYLKKGNWFSLLVLSPALVFLCFLGLEYSKNLFFNFPRHFLSFIFCLGSAIFYVLYLIKNKKAKILGLLLIIISFSVLFIYYKPNNHTYATTLKFSDEEMYFNDNYNVYLEDDLGTVYIDYELEDYCIKGIFNKTGKTVMVLEDENNNKKYYDLEVKSNSFNLKEK